MSDTAGISVLAKLLSRVADGDRLTAAGFASSEGLARSTVFEIVGRMEAAGLVSRSRKGGIVAGPEAARFGLAAFGLAALAGPAEAVLFWLRDETGGTVSLTSADGRIVLLELTAYRGRGAPTVLEQDVCALDGKLRARLRLALPGGSRQEKTVAAARIAAVVKELQAHLNDGGDR